jgi:hypothetical protein
MPTPSLDAVDLEILGLQKQRDKIVARLEDLHKQRDALANDEHAKSVLDNLSDDQRTALIRLAALAAPLDLPGVGKVATK